MSVKIKLKQKSEKVMIFDMNMTISVSFWQLNIQTYVQQWTLQITHNMLRVPVHRLIPVTSGLCTQGQVKVGSDLLSLK